MNSAFRLVIVLFLLVASVFGGIVYLAQAVEPSPRPVEKVLPDDSFPR